MSKELYRIEKYDRRAGVHVPVEHPITKRPVRLKRENAERYLASLRRDDPQAWIYRISPTGAEQ